MTERIDLTKILEVNDDKIVIHLLINLKCIVIVLDPVSLFQNTPHFMFIYLCETNVRYYK